MSEREVRKLDGVARAASIGLKAYIVCGVLWEFVLILSYASTGPLTAYEFEESFDPFWMAWSLVGLAYMVALVGTIICVTRFVYRGMKNLHALDAPQAEMSAGWAVGWYFVPIANLWKPLQGMRQLVEGSYEVGGRDPWERPSLGARWGCWIVGSVIGNMSGRMPDMDEPFLVTSVLSGGLMVAAAVLLLRIVEDVTKAQSGMLAARVFSDA